MFGEEAAPIQVEPDVATRLGDLEAAIDYGLLGQRIESVVRYLGASQALLHERLRVAYAGRTPPTALQQLVEAPITQEHYPLLRTDLPLVETCQREIDLSRWLFARAGEALPGKVVAGSLDELTQLDPAEQATSQRRLAELFGSEPVRDELAAVAAAVFALERRCLRIIEREQGTLNERIKRARGRQLTSIDLATFTRPRNGPPLFATLEAALNISVVSDATTTVVRPRDNGALTFTD
jgi:hypothetical protein